MNVLARPMRGIRELWPIFLVAVGVALAFTLVSSVLDHVHQVNAEALNVHAVNASPGPAAATQTLAIPAWGVQLTLPLVSQFPLMSYANDASASVGLSAADISKLGPDCQAGQNALGSLLRFPRGTYDAAPHGSTIEYFIATIGAYDYAYQMPQGACSDTPTGSMLTNRETSVIQNALSSLSQIQ